MVWNMSRWWAVLRREHDLSQSVHVDNDWGEVEVRVGWGGRVGVGEGDCEGLMGRSVVMGFLLV